MSKAQIRITRTKYGWREELWVNNEKVENIMILQVRSCPNDKEARGEFLVLKSDVKEIEDERRTAVDLL